MEEKNMVIHGLSKLTLLDYPEHIAATVFTGACNFRCPFCHNAGLVMHPEDEPVISEEEFFAWLASRKGKLEGVCVTGGEPTLQSDLFEFIRKIKKLGFLVKLDTNGYRPFVLKKLAQSGLLDYVAMDIKNSRESYAKTAGLQSMNMDAIEESVGFLKLGTIPYEFRTTVVKELHKEKDFEEIGEWLRGDSPYYLQSFVDSGYLMTDGLHGYSEEEMRGIRDRLLLYLPKTKVRGIEE